MPNIFSVLIKLIHGNGIKYFWSDASHEGKRISYQTVPSNFTIIQSYGKFLYIDVEETFEKMSTDSKNKEGEKWAKEFVEYLRSK